MQPSVAPDNGAMTEPAPDLPARAPGEPGDLVSRLAAELDTPPLPPPTVGALLRIARRVAHGSERVNAPLSTYVAGRHVAARVAAGGDEAAALAEVEAAVSRLLGQTPAG